MSLRSIVLVVRRRGWASEIIDFINFHKKRKGDVVPQQLKIRARKKMSDIAPSTGKKVVDTNDFMALFQKCFTQM